MMQLHMNYDYCHIDESWRKKTKRGFYFIKKKYLHFFLLVFYILTK